MDLLRPQSCAGRILMTAAILFLLAATFIFLGVSNHNEAIDAVLFVASAETDAGMHNLVNNRAIYFVYLYRLAFQAMPDLGLGITGYDALCALTAVLGAASVMLLYRLLRVVCRCEQSVALFGAAVLATSYMFLRYSFEVEVYIPSIFLVLASLNLTLPAFQAVSSNLLLYLALGVFAGFAVGVYQLNIIPLFVAMAVMISSLATFWRFAAYSVAGAGAFLTSMVFAYIGEVGETPELWSLLNYISPSNDLVSDGRSLLDTAVKAGLGITHALLSVNWVYGLPGVAGAVESYQPRHFYFAREIFFAANSYGWLVYASALTFSAAVAGWLFALIRSWRLRESVNLDRARVVIWCWLALNMLVACYFNPGEREVWVTTLPPLAAIVALYVGNPLKSSPRFLATIVILTLVHNVVGGLGMYKSPKGDLHAGSTSWIREHGSRSDWVVTSGETFVWYNKMKLLFYPIKQKTTSSTSDEFFNFAHFDGIDGRTMHWFREDKVPTEQMLLQLGETPHRVFLTSDVLTPRRLPARFDHGGQSDHLIQLGQLLQTVTKEADTSEFGNTYELDKPALLSLLREQKSRYPLVFGTQPATP